MTVFQNLYYLKTLPPNTSTNNIEQCCFQLQVLSFAQTLSWCLKISKINDVICYKWGSLRNNCNHPKMKILLFIIFLFILLHVILLSWMFSLVFSWKHFKPKRERKENKNQKEKGKKTKKHMCQYVVFIR